MNFDVMTLTGSHTVLSLVALGAGIIVILGMASARDLPGWAALFLATAVATSATGFLFPVAGILPSHIFGVVSLVALAAAMLGRYRHGFAGRWRITYVLCVVLATWLDAFVAVVQVFLKVPAATALAPTQADPPFAIAQGITLVVFVVLAVLAARRFRPAG
ncbi:hypothetical protein [Roseomonas fluvialis]|uniref:Membrane protein n=1 Tax=Roseomonas fluvialis TaxID=1750527 RepID=A0ABM7Y2U5_9PROT|nr:hypothetical protein [Roseomonas fluvialis]BDG72157.1 membrane protein [Roseomonas fluvialis]